MSGKHNTNKYIAYCRPRDSNSLLAMSQKHLQIAFADLQKRYKNITFLRTTLSDKRFTPKAFIQSCMTTFEPVLNSFIIHRVKTKSNECLSVAFTGHASSPYQQYRHTFTGNQMQNCLLRAVQQYRHTFTANQMQNCLLRCQS